MESAVSSIKTLHQVTIKIILSLKILDAGAVMFLFVCKIGTYFCDFACVLYSIEIGVREENNSC